MSSSQEKFLEIYRNIQNHLKFIDLEDVTAVEKLEPLKEFYAISMSIFTILNNLIELGGELVDFLDLEIPVKYRDIARTYLKTK